VWFTYGVSRREALKGFPSRGRSRSMRLTFILNLPFVHFFVLPFAVALLGFLLLVLVGCRSVDFRVLGYKVVFHVISPVDAISIHQPETLSSFFIKLFVPVHSLLRVRCGRHRSTSQPVVRRMWLQCRKLPPEHRRACGLFCRILTLRHQ